MKNTDKLGRNTFGGIIYEVDFDTSRCMGSMVERIISDWKFDEYCRKNIEDRKLGKKQNKKWGW